MPSRIGTLAAVADAGGSLTAKKQIAAASGNSQISVQAKPYNTGPVRVARSTGVAFMISPVNAPLASLQILLKTSPTPLPPSAITSTAMGTAAAIINPAR